jgi:hypothetical protein
MRLFQNVLICRSVPRSSFVGGGGGIVHCRARADAFYPAALSRLPARYRPRLRMDLNRVAKLPAIGPQRRRPTPINLSDLSRPALDYAMDD